MHKIKRKAIAAKSEEPAPWVAACDELELLLCNAQTALDLVALVQPDGEENANADRTECGHWSSAASQLHYGRSIDGQSRLPLSIVPPLSCSRASVAASVAASSVYSLPDTYALENARLTEPFSPEIALSSFWTDSEEEGSQQKNEQGTFTLNVSQMQINGSDS